MPRSRYSFNRKQISMFSKYLQRARGTRLSITVLRSFALSSNLPNLLTLKKYDSLENDRKICSRIKLDDHPSRFITNYADQRIIVQLYKRWKDSKTLPRRFDVTRLKGFLSTTILFIAGHRHGLDRTLVFTAGYNANADGDARLQSATSVIDCVKNVLRPSFCKRDMHFETRKRTVNVPNIEDTSVNSCDRALHSSHGESSSQPVSRYYIISCIISRWSENDRSVINYHSVRSKIGKNLVKLYRIDRDL